MPWTECSPPEVSAKQHQSWILVRKTLTMSFFLIIIISILMILISFFKGKMCILSTIVSMWSEVAKKLHIVYSPSLTPHNQMLWGFRKKNLRFQKFSDTLVIEKDGIRFLAFNLVMLDELAFLFFSCHFRSFICKSNSACHSSQKKKIVKHINLF